MFNQNDDNYGYGDPVKKKSMFPKILKWTIYLTCLLILVIVVYRLISTGTPKELDHYIIRSPKIEDAYKNLKNDFKIYEIEVRSAFAMGDAMFIEKVYYLESAENLQITVRCKNLKLAQLILSELGTVGDQTRSNNPTSPLKMHLKHSVTADVGETDETEETLEDDTVQDYVILETVNAMTFGKSEDRYKYFVLSFDGVKIDYVKSTVRLYIFLADEENFPDEEAAIARFTIFDINTPKTKVQAKKFILE